MKLVGELKEKVEMAESLEEVKQVIENAGMELTVDELNSVAGGTTKEQSDRELAEILREKQEYKDKCHRNDFRWW